MSAAEQPTLFMGYADPTVPAPLVWRRTDPVTSAAAGSAPIVRVRASSQRSNLLRAFASAGNDGLTDEAAGRKANVRRVADTRRCSELRRAGLIVPTGATRPTSTGCQSMVCIVTAEGLMALRSVK